MMSFELQIRHDWTVQIGGQTYGIREYENIPKSSIIMAGQTKFVPISAPTFGCTLLCMILLVVWLCGCSRKRGSKKKLPVSP